MGKFTADELAEAGEALASTLRKCEKIDGGKRLPKPQQTLLDRRIRALRLAIALIDEKLQAPDKQ